VFGTFDQSSTQGIPFNVAANHEEVAIILNREALVPLLIDVSKPTAVIMGMVTHCVSSAHPTHEAAHFSIDQWTQYKVIVIGHKLIGVELHLMDLQRLVKNSFEGGKVSILVEDVCSEISPIQCVVKPSSFVSTRWSWHSSFLQREQNRIITDMIMPTKRPDPFGFFLHLASSEEEGWVAH
jgi:hypothetical protein